MSFITDRQTREDLGIAGRYKPDSVFGLFNQVSTAGGSRLLEAWFDKPLSDAAEINRRSGLLQYFGDLNLRFPIEQDMFDRVEGYLGVAGSRNIVVAGLGVLYKRALGMLVRDEGYVVLRQGVEATIGFLGRLGGLMRSLEPAGPYMGKASRINALLGDRRLKGLPGMNGLPGAGGLLDAEGLSLAAVLRWDRILRGSMQEEMQELLEMSYELDVYIAVSRVARERRLAYAHALPKESNRFRVTGLSHPALPGSVGNALSYDAESNLVFLTGANMAGKSTLMKAFGIAVYLAHMGFPVAAERLEFSVMDGLYSSINVPDDLGHGYSHFYAEVLRVKKVAEAIGSGKDLVVIFDELFKGTNVKDAYDATLAVTEALAQYGNCFFLISTHIVEVGQQLKEKGGPYRFVYLPTFLDGAQPRYTYRLEEGISADRHGMLIIRMEGLLELIS